MERKVKSKISVSIQNGIKITLKDSTLNPEKVIAEAAAICRKSQCDDEANRNRLEIIMKHKHLSALRFANATFLIEGVSRVTTHQIIRTAHAGFLQASQRYQDCVLAGFVVPPSYHNKDFRHIIEAALERVTEAYELMVSQGIPLEDARYILPNGTATEIIMTGNFQMWHTFLKARLNPAAQWEIRSIARNIADKLLWLAPTVFAEFKSESGTHHE